MKLAPNIHAYRAVCENCILTYLEAKLREHPIGGRWETFSAVTFGTCYFSGRPCLDTVVVV